MQQWDDWIENFRFRLNIKKTEYMECGPQMDGTTNIHGDDLKKVEQFKYFGSTICSNGDSLSDACAQVNAAWSKWHQVTGILCDQWMPLRLKAKIYKTVVRPVALYNSECWPTTVKHEQALHMMEMHVLRWSLGLMCFAVNKHVQRWLGGAPGLEMQEGRLRWYRHVTRSDEHSVACSTMLLNSNGQRPCGRAEKRN